MNRPPQPEIRDDLCFRKVDGDFVVYDPVNDGVVLLNLSAALVYDLCDGTRTELEIAGELGGVFAVDTAKVAGDAATAIAEFTTLGLFKSGASPAERTD